MFAQNGSFAQQLLSRQHSQQPPLSLPQQSPDSFPYNQYEEQRGMDPYGAAQHDQSLSEGPLAHIPPSYRFEFLSSGPSTPYEWYGDQNGMRFGPSAEQAQALQPSVSGLSTRADASGSGDGLSGLATGSAVEAAVMQEQSRIGQSREDGQPPRPPPLALAHSHASKTSSQEQASTSEQAQAHGQSASQAQSQSGSQAHSTPHQHQHPAHPGPIAIPPPPPVTAFPVPPLHTLSPQYYSPIMHPGHPQSPYHHPAMAMAMSLSPAPQDPNVPNAVPSGGAPMQPPYDSSRHMAHAHAHGHVMTPFQPFSPGVTMSPGAFWGRPGGGAVNPFINPAVGAPVHGSPGYFWPPRVGPVEEQGYFPPVPTQSPPIEESYFPQVPTSGSRPSGLANELGRGDSGSDPAGSAGSSSLGADGSTKLENGRAGSGNSEATTGTAATDVTGTGSRPTSSQGTSWRTDVDSEDPGMGALSKELDALAVADEDAAERVNGGEHTKPRAYSTQARAAAHPPPFTRSGSDPVSVRQGESAGTAVPLSMGEQAAAR
ncbi:uncharacterized protein B0H18DRAFT_1115558 [Fomitopsis serialis]|uniref:uncharacterized protein n=1 Tax=Fomitopsis serialis TaxID=139415 RepID=UPI002008AF2B|nr:uncharacterized protein B0H18DRAFT_1115558 [Neoantrodia serialis]KAH9932910.1 hypothetical protein B0H18DRAFT_1115558 [Neoantrodia serialis]